MYCVPSIFIRERLSESLEIHRFSIKYGESNRISNSIISLVPLCFSWKTRIASQHWRCSYDLAATDVQPESAHAFIVRRGSSKINGRSSTSGARSGHGPARHGVASSRPARPHLYCHAHRFGCGPYLGTLVRFQLRTRQFGGAYLDSLGWLVLLL